LIQRRDLLAYADDIIIASNSNEELIKIINEISELENEWGLKLNKAKSEILCKKYNKVTLSKAIPDIIVKDKISYLGMNLSFNLEEMRLDLKE
jgi:hypothetical protein